MLSCTTATVLTYECVVTRPKVDAGLVKHGLALEQERLNTPPNGRQQANEACSSPPELDAGTLELGQSLRLMKNRSGQEMGLWPGLAQLVATRKTLEVYSYLAFVARAAEEIRSRE